MDFVKDLLFVVDNCDCVDRGKVVVFLLEIIVLNWIDVMLICLYIFNGGLFEVE